MAAQEIGDKTHRKYSKSSISPVGLGTCIIQVVEEQLEIHVITRKTIQILLFLLSSADSDN